jgi:hypothetical protein
MREERARKSGWDGTYGTQLAKERAEIAATRTAELFFEEIEVDDDVRYCVFIYLLDSSLREEVLYRYIYIYQFRVVSFQAPLPQPTLPPL